jgi:hypothetical protein
MAAAAKVAEPVLLLLPIMYNSSAEDDLFAILYAVERAMIPLPIIIIFI